MILKIALSIVVSSIAMLVSAVGLRPPGPAVELDEIPSKQLEELNRDFTFKGKPVHPRAIRDLTSWVSDTRSGPVALDVEGTFDTNRYFGEYTVNEKGWVVIDYRQDYLEEKESFGYKRLGVLKNGMHVIHTSYWAGGSGIFESLLILEGGLDYRFTGDGRKTQFLVLKQHGEFGIGDRYAGAIKILKKENAIIVGADKRNENQTYRIDLERAQPALDKPFDLSVGRVGIGTKLYEVLEIFGKPLEIENRTDYPCDDEGPTQILKYDGLTLQLIKGSNDDFFVAKVDVRSKEYLLSHELNLGMSAAQVVEKLGDSKLVSEDGEYFPYFVTDGYAKLYFSEGKLSRVVWELNVC